MVACIDYLCPFCKGSGCDRCKNTGRLRLPAGTVLKEEKKDTEEQQEPERNDLS